MELKPIFEKALKRFEEQFKVELEPTGCEIDYDENDGVGEVEYWVKGLIESKTDALQVEVGGWFAHDTRDNEDRIYCTLAVKINGELLNPDYALQSWYDVEKDEWERFIWDSL